MKNFDSFLENAHIAITGLTMIIFCVGLATAHKQISQHQSYAWLDYAPGNEGFMVLAEQENLYAKAERSIEEKRADMENLAQRTHQEGKEKVN